MRWKIKRRNANLRRLSQLHVFVFFKCKLEKFPMTVQAMCLCIEVAELNTLFVGKGITGIPSTFFMRCKIQMEPQIYVYKLADIYMSTKRSCQGHRKRSAVSVTQITVDVGHPNQFITHRCRSPKLPQNVSFHKNPRSQSHPSQVTNPSPLLCLSRSKLSKLERIK